MKKSSVKKNFAYQFIYQMLISILPFVTSPYISRVLGADNIGIYSYVYSVITIFIVVANLGISNYGNRIIAKSRDDKDKLSKNFTELFVLHLILSAMMLSVYIAYILIFDLDNKLIFIIQILFLIANSIDISWLFFGLEQFKLTVTRNALVKILAVILIFLVVKSRNDLWKYTLIMSTATLLSQITLWGFFKKYTSFCKIKLSNILIHMKPMLVLFAAAIAVTIFNYIDKVMLGSMSSMQQLGFYENAHKIIEFPTGFITAIGAVLLPKIANLLSKKDEKQVKRYIGLSMQFSMLAASAIFFGVSAVAKEFSYLFWGKEFITSGVIIQYLSVCIILMSWNSVIRTQYLIPNEKDKSYLLAVSMSAIINVIINYLLIPKYGAVGAAIGTICSYLMIFLMQNVSVYKELPLLYYAKKVIPYFIIGFIMNSIIRIINNYTSYSIMFLILKILLGAIVFISLLILYAIIFRDEFIVENLKKIKSSIELKIKKVK